MRMIKLTRLLSFLKMCKRQKGYEWCRHLSDYRRCGSCLFVEGGWEHTFHDGHKDYAYNCMLERIVKIDGTVYAVLWRYNDDRIVFHHQRACSCYVNCDEYDLVFLPSHEKEAVLQKIPAFYEMDEVDVALIKSREEL